MSHFIVRGWWTWAAALVSLAATVVTMIAIVIVSADLRIRRSQSPDSPWKPRTRFPERAMIP